MKICTVDYIARLSPVLSGFFQLAMAITEKCCFTKNKSKDRYVQGCLWRFHN